MARDRSAQLTLKWTGVDFVEVEEEDVEAPPPPPQPERVSVKRVTSKAVGVAKIRIIGKTP